MTFGSVFALFFQDCIAAASVRDFYLEALKIQHRLPGAHITLLNINTKFITRSVFGGYHNIL